MAFVTRADIEGRLTINEARQKAGNYHVKASTDRHYIFLSHSHRDKQLVEQFVALLGEHANYIYIDWADKSVPDNCTPATALYVKSKIHQCHKLVLLATGNACISRWCPWELGIGDEANGMTNVLIFPVVEPNRTWPGNEYIGIYNYVEKDFSGRLLVVDPVTKQQITLGNWLMRAK
jgi:TIR domain-containing protein